MVQIWGHRGCRGDGNPPENSLAAFSEAIAQGADGIELDVFLSRDGALVVFHDDTLERMSEDAGNVTDFSVEELRRVPLKDAQGRLSAERIPTLDEVMALVSRLRGKKNGFIVNIEIKQQGIAGHVARALEHYIADGWNAGHFVVSSFDMDSLRVIRGAFANIGVGMNFEGPAAPWNIGEGELRRKLSENTDISAQTVHIPLPSLTPEAARLILQTGAKPVAWTWKETNPLVLAPQEMSNIRDAAGYMSALITDYPKEMRRLLTLQPQRGGV